jgi:translation initiation factor 5A
MSDNEDDYKIESTDAGASATIPMEAGQIKKGGHMMIKGKPCKVNSISVSKTGKHGHAKCNFVAVDIFTGKKYEDMIPSSHGTTVPIVNRSDWEIIDIEEDGALTLMDEAGNQKTDLNLPTFPDELADQIRDAWNGGENSVIVTVQAAVGIEQIIAFKKENA